MSNRRGWILFGLAQGVIVLVAAILQDPAKSFILGYLVEVWIIIARVAERDQNRHKLPL